MRIIRIFRLPRGCRYSRFHNKHPGGANLTDGVGPSPQNAQKYLPNFQPPPGRTDGRLPTPPPSQHRPRRNCPTKFAIPLTPSSNCIPTRIPVASKPLFRSPTRMNLSPRSNLPSRTRTPAPLRIPTLTPHKIYIYIYLHILCVHIYIYIDIHVSPWISMQVHGYTKISTGQLYGTRLSTAMVDFVAMAASYSLELAGLQEAHALMRRVLTHHENFVRT